jgi:hypothetical protein
MELWQIGLIVLAVIVVLGAIAWTISQRQRTERLTKQYGPEYQRTVEAAGDRREGERELVEREKRVKGLEIRPLAAEERERYAASWKETQAEFVDDPSGAISHADELVQRVMRDRGYPTTDFEQRAADISVDHPQVVEDYRAAHAIAVRHASDGVETEDLRQAMVHYRSLFDDLLETAAGRGDDDRDERDDRDDAERNAERKREMQTGGVR